MASILSCSSVCVIQNVWKLLDSQWSKNWYDYNRRTKEEEYDDWDKRRDEGMAQVENLPWERKRDFEGVSLLSVGN